MYQSMKIKDLKNYGIPSYVVNIWEKHYSRDLLPIQEEAVRNYGILSCGENEDKEGRMQYAPTEGNDKREEARNNRSNNNLLVIAPPSSGKSFLGEMAAMAQAIHQKKIIYLTPLRFYAEEKYSHFKNLYGNCGAESIISTRTRKEDDCRIIQGDYKLVVMDFEKFNYFLLIYPKFLTDVSLVIIDEMQIIDDPKWGPLLEEIIDQLLKKDLVNLRIIALSALIENQDTLLKWFPAHPLISYPQTVEIRKGVVREGVFKYTTLNEENTCGKEVFFQPEAVRDNCFEDYLLETVKYFIKIVCASTKYSIGLNLPFKNIIIPSDKMHNDDGNYLHDFRTNLNLADVGNMGRRAANENFGRIIFLAYSMLSETIHQNTYSNSTQGSTVNRQLVKDEKDLLTYLLRLSVKYRLKPKEIKEYVKDGGNHPSGYWQFSFDKENIEKKIDRYLNILKGNKLIREIKGGVLSPTANGILITALIIKVKTYLFLKNWMEYSKKGEISDLEILLLLAFSADGRALPIPFSQFYRDDEQKESYDRGCRGNYRNKLLHLILKQGDEDKKLYRDKIILKKTKEDSIPLEDYLAFKKTCLLHDWIQGDKDIKIIEQENRIYGGVVQILGEGFSWLADSLMEIAKNEGWKKGREKDLNKIKILSERLIDGVEEYGLNLSQLHIPGLSRYYIKKLLHAGYNNGQCLKELSEEELAKVLSQKLARRIKKGINFKNGEFVTENRQLKTDNFPPETRNPQLETFNFSPAPRILQPVPLFLLSTH
jgi:replicative superfamily II helicase